MPALNPLAAGPHRAERLLGYANVEPYPAKCSYRSCRGLSGPCARIRQHSRGIRCLCSWRSLLAQVLAALSVPLTRLLVACSLLKCTRLLSDALDVNAFNMDPTVSG